jgi:alkylated DNA nucleotide flippase Atl1
VSEFETYVEYADCGDALPSRFAAIPAPAELAGSPTRAQSVAGILVSHDLHHVFVSRERVVAMARGRIVLDKRLAETSIDEIVRLM